MSVEKRVRELVRQRQSKRSSRRRRKRWEHRAEWYEDEEDIDPVIVVLRKRSRGTLKVFDRRSLKQRLIDIWKRLRK